jgi:cysteine-S-conjugate beta-lyase
MAGTFRAAAGPPFDRVGLPALRARRTLKWTRHPPDVLPAWVAEMDVGVAEPVREALLAAIARGELGYPPPGDRTELPAACAGFLAAAHGWAVDPAAVHPVCDVLTGVRIALGLSGAPGTPVVLPTPAYPPFFDVVRQSGRPPAEVPMVDGPGGFALDLDGVDRALRAGATAVLLCTPHNPTGRVFRRAELAALAATVERHGARVVSDEVHAPLAHPGHRHVPYAAATPEGARHTITVVSASKAWNMPGVKCAQVVLTDPADRARWEEAVPAFEQAGASPLGIAANIAAYTAGGQWLAQVRAQLDVQRTALAGLVDRHLPGVRYRVPEATYLAWLDCRGLGLDRPPGEVFLDRGRVAVNDGAEFGAAGAGFVRLNFGTAGDRLEEIVRRMGVALR